MMVFAKIIAKIHPLNDEIIMQSRLQHREEGIRKIRKKSLPNISPRFCQV